MEKSLTMQHSLKSFIFFLLALLTAMPAGAQDFFGNMKPGGSQQAQQSSGSNSKSKKKVKPKPDKPNKVDEQGRRQGEWALKYPNGLYRYVATYRDGVVVGTATRYDEDGHKTLDMTYDADSDTCRVITYHDNGKVESRGQYVQKLREGTWRLYNYDGGLMSIIEFSHGLKHGTERILYNSGRVMERIPWVDGYRHGVWTRFFTNGRKLSEGTFDHDQLSGLYTEWAGDGKIAKRGSYDAGVMVGTWHVRYDDVPGQNLEVDIVYDKHGLVVNRAEVDSVETLRVKAYEMMNDKVLDPQDFQDDPEGYLLKSKSR